MAQLSVVDPRVYKDLHIMHLVNPLVFILFKGVLAFKTMHTFKMIPPEKYISLAAYKCEIYLGRYRIMSEYP